MIWLGGKWRFGSMWSSVYCLCEETTETQSLCVDSQIEISKVVIWRQNVCKYSFHVRKIRDYAGHITFNNTSYSIKEDSAPNFNLVLKFVNFSSGFDVFFSSGFNYLFIMKSGFSLVAFKRKTPVCVLGKAGYSCVFLPCRYGWIFFFYCFGVWMWMKSLKRTFKKKLIKEKKLLTLGQQTL